MVGKYLILAVQNSVAFCLEVSKKTIRQGLKTEGITLREASVKCSMLM